MDASGEVVRGETVSTHVVPFPGANIDPRALEITGIDPTHPFRAALDEKLALEHVFAPLRKVMKATDCTRAVLVGHNAHFDLGFVNAAIKRTGHKRSPFHPFSCFDTVSLAGLALGQTVLSRAVQCAGLRWNADEAHSAVYDAEKTADLFCLIVNRWKQFADSAPDAAAMTAGTIDAEAEIAAAQALDAIDAAVHAELRIFQLYRPGIDGERVSPSLHVQLEAEGFGRQMADTQQPTPHTELGAVVECFVEAFGDDGAALADLFGLLLRCTFDEKIVRVP